MGEPEPAVIKHIDKTHAERAYAATANANLPISQEWNQILQD